ncbi:hypothetical protein KFK14_12890 [Sphingobium phenoxybenzoativorans]|uniref:Uncharacterized protein n=1 Tax=Sphingobium phenoxybenzoativorans TaxID=1592790 RepID=A0A975K352_9SPHN|nr:hypothetical protein KFK14_12890 [Sphingobium phenoxybenzoativorans]
MIIRLSREGLYAREIADRLGLSQHTVQAYMQRRGLSARKHGSRPILDPDILRRLVEQDRMTQPDIAKLLGCSRSAVDRTCRRLGLKSARTGPRSGEDHHDWKGGRVLDKHGYVEIYAPLHPQAKKSTGRVGEHRLVMEVVLCRYLTSDEVVDHQDDHPRHNWPDNLHVYATNADHLRATLTGRLKATPRSSIPGAYGCSQKIDHCPGESETLALAPEPFRLALAEHIEIHRPTKEHAAQSRSSILRSGPIRPAFQYKSME